MVNKAKKQGTNYETNIVNRLNKQDNFKSQSISEKMTQFKSVIKNNIPSPPIETEGEDGGGFDNLSDLFKGMGAFTSESNDFQEDVLAAPLVDADPLKEAVVIR